MFLWFTQIRGEPGQGWTTAAFALCGALVLAAPFVLPTPGATGVLLCGLTAASVKLGCPEAAHAAA
ncbi:MAG: hypothetical protein KC620_21575 [Myxococcales bacterium]|nr:hypothetical protein [Myxococcales bacterium]